MNDTGSPETLGQSTRLLRFCVVGGTGVVVNMSVFWAVLLLAEDAWPTWFVHNAAGVLGFAVSCLGNFFLNDAWTWGDRRAVTRMPLLQRLGSYFLVALGALAIQLLVLNGTTALFENALPEAYSSWGPHLANLLGIAAGTVVNFVLNHLWTFRKQNEAGA